MSEFQRYNTAQTRTGVAIDEGLRKYMLGVYNYMSLALAFTTVVGLGVATLALSNAGVFNLLYNTPLRFVFAFAPLAMIFFAGGIMRRNKESARGFLFVFAAAMGLSISGIFIIYPVADLVNVFAITSIMFASLSLWSYTTKKDLSGWGSFLRMGLIGLILVMIFNFIFGSGNVGLELAINVVGVLIFSGLTAYYTQSIKEMYFEGDSADAMGQKQISGALNLYLSFLNLFLFLLQLTGMLGGDE